MSQSISEQLAEWALGLEFVDLPGEVVEDAKLRILDTLGLILSAAANPIGASVNRAVARLGAGNEARMIPSGIPTTAANAALAHGTQAHAEDFDDTHNESIMHSSASVVPVILALGEAQSISGEKALTLVAIGNEINCRLGCVLPGAFHEFGFHPTGVLGALTAALLASRMLDVDTTCAVNAMGIAGSQASGILEAYEDGSWSKTLHAGWAAHAGAVAGLLAQSGFTGPRSVLEGRFGIYRSFLHGEHHRLAFDRATDGLGQHWVQLDSSFKPYPCAHAIHAFVDVALALRDEHAFEVGEITRIEALVAEHFVPMICEPWAAKIRPRTPTHARASLPYAIAVALVHGELSPEHYTPDAIVDPSVLAVAEKITYELDPDAPPSTQYQGIVKIATMGGDCYRGILEHNRGSRENPMTRDELLNKFHRCGRTLSKRRRTSIIKAIDTLENMKDLGKLIDKCLSKDNATT